MLQDRPQQFQAGVAPTRLNLRTTEAAWYFEDEFKLRTNLTMRLGMRDEMTTGWNEVNGRSANYIYDRAGFILTQPYVGRSWLTENYAIALLQTSRGLEWDP